MKPLLFLFAAIALLILAGCSTTRGVERTVRLNQNQRISQAAVIAAIQQTPGVILVKKQHLTPTTGYGVVDFHNKSTDRYVYVSDLRHADGVIEIGGNDRDGLRLKMYCLFQNTRPSADLAGFHRFLAEKVANGGTTLSPEEALDEWRLQHPVPQADEDDGESAPRRVQRLGRRRRGFDLPPIRQPNSKEEVNREEQKTDQAEAEPRNDSFPGGLQPAGSRQNRANPQPLDRADLPRNRIGPPPAAPSVGRDGSSRAAWATPPPPGGMP
jgi:hypothetical protein